MFCIECIRAPWKATRIPNILFSTIVKNTGIKWAGATIGYAFVLIAWGLLNEYRTNYYSSFFALPSAILIVIPFLMAAFILFTEWRLGPSEDHDWHMGQLILNYKGGKWKAGMIRDGLLGWAIKGFFAPLNICSAISNINYFRGKETDILTYAWPRMEYVADEMIFTVLLIAIIPGYLFGSRLINTDNKGIDHSWFGWMVTLFCYPPLNTAGAQGIFHFFNSASPPWNQPWVIWSDKVKYLVFVIGGLLLFLEFIHYWGEAIFCLRASNLTNRGIITNGPYRFCKHPVYLAKCIAWAIIWLPFFEGNSVIQSLRFTIGFFAFCGVYILRAWVEERLLSKDQTYVEYALWIDRHGTFRWIGHLLPWFNYEYRLKKWKSIAK
jgi:protein-S-isoprenylcysteine O-methyltransferase Ste14